MRILESGVDTLIVGYHVESYIDHDDFLALSEAKASAGEKMFDSKGKGVTWFGTDFMVKPRGSAGYEFILVNDDVMVCIAREPRSGKVMPEVYVTYSSKHLWDKGIEAATEAFKRWLCQWAVVVGEKVSRADLAQDIELDFPELDIRREALTLAKGKVDFIEGQHYMYGCRSIDYRFGSGDLVGRVYDKVAEVKKHQKEYVLDNLRAAGWDGETGVTRAEFQCRRGFLKQYEVESVRDLIMMLPDIWRYCTHDWLRICQPSADSNRARWAVRDFWKLLQSGFRLFGHALGVLKQKVKQVKYEHLMEQLKGCGESACAAVASLHGFGVAYFKFKSDLRDWILSNDFEHSVMGRVPAVSNMEKPQTHLVDAVLKIGGVIVSVDS